MSAHDDMSARSAGRTGLYAVVSLVAGVVAAAGMFGFGTPILAVFAVGAGHVALGRSRERQRGSRLMAMIGLALGYGLAVWGLVLVVGNYLPAVLTQR